jgi:predicted acetyltransferase
MRLATELLDFALELRALGEAQLSQVRELRRDCIEEYVARFGGQIHDPPSVHQPPSTYCVLAKGELVGMSELRPEADGGCGTHAAVSFYVRAAAKRRGLTAAIVARTLTRARELGYQRALLTCDSTDRPSRAAIEHNFGQFEREVQHQARTIRKYWVDLC